MSFDPWDGGTMEENGCSREPFKGGAGGMEPDGFTWHPSYTETLIRIQNREQQVDFLFGVIGYGAYGTYPDFRFPLDAMFEAIKPNIDSSKKRIQGGKKGGRSKREEGES